MANMFFHNQISRYGTHLAPVPLCFYNYAEFCLHQVVWGGPSESWAAILWLKMHHFWKNVESEGLILNNSDHPFIHHRALSDVQKQWKAVLPSEAAKFPPLLFRLWSRTLSVRYYKCVVLHPATYCTCGSLWKWHWLTARWLQKDQKLLFFLLCTAGTSFSLWFQPPCWPKFPFSLQKLLFHPSHIWYSCHALSTLLC